MGTKNYLSVLYLKLVFTLATFSVGRAWSMVVKVQLDTVYHKEAREFSASVLILRKCHTRPCSQKS